MKKLLILAALVPTLALAAPDPAKLRDAALDDTTETVEKVGGRNDAGSF